MFRWFQHSDTPPNGAERHAATLDLIEQVAIVRGRLGALEVEWSAVKETVQKGYARMERANERAEKRKTMEDEEPERGQQAAHEAEPAIALVGFAKKLQEMKEG